MIVYGDDDCCCGCCEGLDQICLYFLIGLMYVVLMTFLILFILRFTSALGTNGNNFFGRSITNEIIPNYGYNKSLENYDSIILNTLLKSFL